MTDRAHAYRVITDSDGRPAPGTVVTFKDEAGGTFPDPLYTTNDGTTEVANPLTTSDGSVEIFTSAEARVIFSYVLPGAGSPLTAVVDTTLPAVPGADDSFGAIDPDNPSTVPSVYYIKDADSVVWAVTVDTFGHLTTTEH